MQSQSFRSYCTFVCLQFYVYIFCMNPTEKKRKNKYVKHCKGKRATKQDLEVNHYDMDILRHYTRSEEPVRTYIGKLGTT